MREKIQHKKYKRAYQELLVLGVWVFVLFLFSNIIYGRCVAQCPVNIQRDLVALRIIIFMTGMVIITSWFFIKNNPDNYTLIELEGNVIEPKKRRLP